MTTPPIVSITDGLIAELEAAANACGPMLLDSAETLTPGDAGAIECPVCFGEGYASLENDYCNFDNHAIGVQFYGIGSDFGAGERYFRAALLPPVGCPLVVYIDGQIYRAERTNHLTDKYGQMDYALAGGQVIRGRFEWSYP